MFFVLQLALMKKAVSLLILLLCTIYSFTQVSIFSVNGSWKFNDSGLDLGSLWKESNFNDGTWTSGNAELGYGDGDENTVVSYGNSSSNKHITTYFRKTFYLNNPNQFQEIIGSIKRDDGAVVYVNGYEVFRTNLKNQNQHIDGWIMLGDNLSLTSCSNKDNTGIVQLEGGVFGANGSGVN